MLINLKLPGCSYDAVWFDSGLHHVEALEDVCEQIEQALRPDGLLVLNEYIGPNRFQFSERQKEVATLCLRLLPVKFRIAMREALSLDMERTPLRKGGTWFAARLIDKLKDGDLIAAIHRRLQTYKEQRDSTIGKVGVTFPSARDVIAADPSEAVRSADIVAVLGRSFEILEQTGWGGNVLQFLLAGIAGNFSEKDGHSLALLRMLINIEDTLIQCGEFESDFAYIVARPRRL